MKKIILFTNFYFFLASFLTAQNVIISEIKHEKIALPCIILESKYPVELVQESLISFMKNKGYTLSPFSMNFAYKTFKKVALEKMPNDSTPYLFYNLTFKIQEEGVLLKKRTLLTCTIFSDKGGVINLEKYRSILESAKKFIEQFEIYFEKKFIPEREISIIKQSIEQLKQLSKQTYQDSIETHHSIKQKIMFHENELSLLYTSQKTQNAIFNNSLTVQKKQSDSLKIKLDSLQNKYFSTQQ